MTTIFKHLAYGLQVTWSDDHGEIVLGIGKGYHTEQYYNTIQLNQTITVPNFRIHLTFTIRIKHKNKLKRYLLLFLLLRGL